MYNTDTRVQYTKKVLKDTLIVILNSKPIDRVTVKEVCDAAGINRGTFYLHYAMPLDLLKEIENDFVAANLAILETYDGKQGNIEFTNLIFDSLRKNRDLCKIILGPNGDPQFLSSIAYAVKDTMIEEWAKENPKFSKENLDFVYDFVFTGSSKIILNWIEGGCEMPASKIAKRIERLGHYSQMAIREF